MLTLAFQRKKKHPQQRITRAITQQHSTRSRSRHDTDDFYITPRVSFALLYLFFCFSTSLLHNTRTQTETRIPVDTQAHTSHRQHGPLGVFLSRESYPLWLVFLFPPMDVLRYIDKQKDIVVSGCRLLLKTVSSILLSKYI